MPVHTSEAIGTPCPAMQRQKPAELRQAKVLGDACHKSRMHESVVRGHFKGISGRLVLLAEFLMQILQEVSQCADASSCFSKRHG
jgi:hypothetical protein